MKTVEEKMQELNTLTRTSTRSKADIEAIVMKEMDTFVGTKVQLIEKENELKQKVQDIYKKERNERNEQIGNLWNEIQEDVSAEEGLQNHPKNSKAWAMAWEEGHSSGYWNVVNHYRTLCELLKD